IKKNQRDLERLRRQLQLKEKTHSVDHWVMLIDWMTKWKWTLTAQNYFHVGRNIVSVVINYDTIP
ncbi:unnamed protein product, partial [Allacma fusca]